MKEYRLTQLSKRRHRPDDVIVVIVPKHQSGEEDPTALALCAMLVDYTMPNSHGKWESTKLRL